MGYFSCLSFQQRPSLGHKTSLTYFSFLLFKPLPLIEGTENYYMKKYGWISCQIHLVVLVMLLTSTFFCADTFLVHLLMSCELSFCLNMYLLIDLTPFAV